MADINPNALLEFARTITSGGQPKSGAKLATVTRVDENGTAYVQLPGGEETPIATTGAVYNIGDVVSVSMYGGKLRTVDNISAPSVSERVVRAVVRPVSKAAELAKKSASEAEAVANAVNQHFWDDDNGAHVTDVTKDEWKKAVDDGFSDLSDNKQYSNVLLNSLGMLLRSALNNLVSITRSAIAFYDGLGNNATNITAQFGKDGAQIGYADESHLELDYHSMQLVDKEGDTYFHVSDLRDSNGDATINQTIIADGNTSTFHLSFGAKDTSYTVMVYDQTTDVTSSYTVSSKSMSSFTLTPTPTSGYAIKITFETTAQAAKAFTFGERMSGSSNLGGMSACFGDYVEASGYVSFAQGYETKATGAASFAEGSDTIASGESSHAEGSNTSAIGKGSHAEGYGTLADGINSHAEGTETMARSTGSHAEGYQTSAYGGSSHAEGWITSAGETAHSEGWMSKAIGTYSHAEGYGTLASGAASHAEGYGQGYRNNDYGPTASGDYSHAQNYYTVAASDAQTAMGKCNVIDDGDTYALIIGNGSINAKTGAPDRSNAFAVKWDGTVDHAGDVAWTNLPLSSGWQAYSSNWTPKYRRVGQMVEVRGAVSPTAATLLDANDVVFANLPQGCRPTVSVVHVCQSSGVKIWTLSITDAGEVRAGRLRTMNSTNYQSAGTSEWLVFDVTFLI